MVPDVQSLSVPTKPQPQRRRFQNDLRPVHLVRRQSLSCCFGRGRSPSRQQRKFSKAARPQPAWGIRSSIPINLVLRTMAFWSRRERGYGAPPTALTDDEAIDRFRRYQSAVLRLQEMCSVIGLTTPGVWSDSLNPRAGCCTTRAPERRSNGASPFTAHNCWSYRWAVEDSNL